MDENVNWRLILLVSQLLFFFFFFISFGLTKVTFYRGARLFPLISGTQKMRRHG